jgi:hypothetical protein
MSVRQRWGWLVIWGGIVALIGLVELFGHLGHDAPWDTVTAGRIAWYHQEECETVDTKGFFVQFHNFWSNSAYLAAGLLILWFNDSAPGRFLGALLCFLSFVSAWFHGTLTETGQTMDIAGVYLVLLAIISYGFVELIPWSYNEARTWILMIATGVLGFVAAFLRGKNIFGSDYFTPMLVFIIIGYMATAPFVRKSGLGSDQPGAGGGKGWPAAIAVGSGLLALVFKFSDGDDNLLLAQHHGDYSKCFYGADSIIQGHALWHVLSAVMFVGMFEYFRCIRGRSLSVFPWRRDGSE